MQLCWTKIPPTDLKPLSSLPRWVFLIQSLRPQIFDCCKIFTFSSQSRIYPHFHNCCSRLYFSWNVYVLKCMFNQNWLSDANQFWQWLLEVLVSSLETALGHESEILGLSNSLINVYVQLHETIQQLHLIVQFLLWGSWEMLQLWKKFQLLFHYKTYKIEMKHLFHYKLFISHSIIKWITELIWLYYGSWY